MIICKITAFSLVQLNIIILFYSYAKKQVNPICVDYCNLKKKTIINRDPIQRTENTLDHIGHATIFSKIDLAS